MEETKEYVTKHSDPSMAFQIDVSKVSLDDIKNAYRIIGLFRLLFKVTGVEIKTLMEMSTRDLEGLCEVVHEAIYHS
jgi:hypothetical protein